jgi:predicted GIY-YIG superfamily endonuclease
MAGGYIYVLGSHTGTLYIGVTSNLLRVMQHKEGRLEGFTAAYGCKRLLYFEGYEDIRAAIARDKILFSGFGGRKGPNSMGKISTFGVLRLRATKRCVTR